MAVVLYHLCYEIFGVIFPAFRNPVIAALNGQLAVCVFFVLSGEALSSSFFAGKGGSAVASLAVKRYPRLVIPIAASMLLVLIVRWFGLVYAQPAGAIVNRTDWLGAFVRDPPELLSTIKFIGLRVFETATPDMNQNPFLWTMGVEMLGSVVVFGVLLLWDHIRYAVLLTIGGSVILLHWDPTCYVSAFLAGLLFARARRDDTFVRLAEHPLAAWTSGAVIVGCLATSIFCIHRAWLQTFPAISIALVGAVNCNTPVQRFLRNRLSQVLGELSFPLYLVQFAVIVSFTSWCIVALHRGGMLTPLAAMLVVLVSTGVIVALAIAFDPVERFTKMVGMRLARLLVRQPPAQLS